MSGVEIRQRAALKGRGGGGGGGGGGAAGKGKRSGPPLCLGLAGVLSFPGV